MIADTAYTVFEIGIPPMLRRAMTEIGNQQQKSVAIIRNIFFCES